MTRIFLLIFALTAVPAFAEKPSADLTSVRGFNYTTSLDESIGPGGHSGLWLKYDANQVERDLANAERLNLNQVRVFVAYSAWEVDPALSNRNLLDFLHACQRHHIGVMLGLIDQPRPIALGAHLPPELKSWLEGIVKLTEHEPALHKVGLSVVIQAQRMPVLDPSATPYTSGGSTVGSGPEVAGRNCPRARTPAALIATSKRSDRGHYHSV
jgi:hypothetical protein